MASSGSRSFILFALAYIRIGNRADAEDIIKDVFLKLFRSEENLRHVNRLEHYLKLAFRNDNQWQSWEVDGGI